MTTAGLPEIPADLASKIHGCWLGKSIGGTLGIPTEGKKERQHLTFYDPIPSSAPPNDDLELQLVWLYLLETGGPMLTQEDFARGWIDHIHYMWDEYGRCRWNLRRGVPVEALGTFENWFQSSMGSPIRSEIWACLFPGDPESAAHYAAMDASLDHGAEGIAGEVFLAVMQNLVLGGAGVPEAVGRALEFIPDTTELADAVEQVRGDWMAGEDVWATREHLLRNHGHENFTHAPLNVALTVLALLFGDGDFERSILLAVNCGYDTDCTAATAGATLGLALGAESIPKRWSEPLGEGVFFGPGIQGIEAPATLSDLTRRTLALHGKLERRTWTGWSVPQKMCASELSSLRGGIPLLPLDGTQPVLWANGELPAAVKAAGGAEWEWEIQRSEPRHLMVLARAGATLFLDDKELFACPPGLDFVPAPSRSPKGSRADIVPSPGRHRIRLQLGSRDENQDASVILAYPNRHLAPWTADELPLDAKLLRNPSSNPSL